MKRLMKIKIAILIFSIAFIPELSFAQLSINSSGTVSINKAHISTGTVTNSIQFTGRHGLIIENVYGYLNFRPLINNTTTLGTSTKAFNRVYTYNLTTLSDQRFKENIRALEGSLDIIMSLNGVRYDWKENNYPRARTNSSSSLEKKIEKERTNVLGFIAQDVYQVLPEVVNYDDSADIYGIDYTKIIPLLVEGMKEQQIQIEKLNAQISLLTTINSNDQNLDIRRSNNKLFQNEPNPSNGTTTIKFKLVDNSKSSKITIFDLQGTQLRSYQIANKKDLHIQPGELEAGMYFYSLIIDNNVIDTKKMVITE